MSELLGIISALTAALAFGSYIVPMKKIKQPNIFQFQALMCTGIFLLSLILVSILKYSFNFNLFAIVSGFLWAIGNILSLIAVKEAGLARTMPIWVAGVVLIPFFVGILYFNELPKSLIFGLIGSVLIIIGASIVAVVEKLKKKSSVKGILLAAIAGVFFGTYIIPLKLYNLTANEFFFPISLGIFICSWMIFALKSSRIQTKVIPYSLVSGAIWNIGNLASIFAVIYLGLAKGFPLTQLAVLIASAWGLFYFKEVKERNKIVKIIIGAVALMIGAVLLSFAK